MNRLVYSVLIAFLISILEGPILIPILHKFKFGQSIREEGPKSHLKKAGTPTMGGIIFILAAFITMAILVKNPSDEAMIALYAFVAFGIIGAVDDILKIIKKRNLGLRAYQKMILLLITSAIFACYSATNPDIGTSIIVPFLHRTWDLGKFYIPFIIVYFAATTNAVNLTDGLDGLATSVTLLVMTFLALVSFAMGHITLAVFCAVLAGALLGFLRYNAFPAKVFMGDTGSLALGGAVAAVAMILKLPLLVIIIGGIYVIEALSVILQVASFKLTGKRIFKMSPIHHHFELSGWHETKVVSIFCIITVILCLFGFLAL
ncbi:phospho-N-acetylmuramoyl-pentapeptide-transferase [Clostridium luticellarii]|jgi:phospho-N-acetylmuramoyl-pentapeptide-transferase|uniref:Phospho-N-acetylmuramoyl-pentapeptide-transferase n=1 Tax=Clostridium luticellarii TaxID=1691940 RepID=A0A2T0BRS4_9CLOT|nr:phospho-N-acetylmuramoyl-pentapeptide-transferase [Clostridium luticellarii]MCI1943710.1 phospho-N-acetylmuramoyl-pentapeptide-transferase [Clostridium luticellarii]MCI1966971.1 phospho-N-acetylmuramoyl-pentapeptide-transferase [Clostridium luticellarii]MCI1994338.1 phospho-N-acetylmuramoyl-pentapeptide-transferase [Clostridium luticellarii]MCI2038709.1 phospho-N-acetylmuramoyl-pentapeptide-transferase [Clostridium luticellarii]PRR86584.1 Phospho-N-acetylmuramoyl-pentapeptide-transferase [C